jgi:hypothetical protein
VLFVALVLYVALGKGFAYAGVPPIFVGEVLLVFVVFGGLGAAAPVPRSAAALIAAGLFGLAAVQVVVDGYGGADPALEVIRGVAPIYYAAFAFSVFALLRQVEGGIGRQATLHVVDQAFDRVVPLVLVTVFVLAMLLVVEPSWLPVWPISGAPVLWSKSTDLAVALTILLPMLAARGWTAREADMRRLWSNQRLLWTLWLAATLLVTFRSRGALLGLLLGGFAVRPDPERIAKAVVMVVLVLAALYITQISFDVAGREVSFSGAVDSAASLVGDPSPGEIDGNYVGTRQWRSEWWGAIWSDVISEPMLLNGHGWGDNLAVRYGVVAARDEADPRVLRAPHNIFFSLAGRGGLVVAAGFMAMVAGTVVPTFRAGTSFSLSPALQAARGGVVAIVVTALTDVYLESPQGAILFWSLVGLLWWACAGPVRDSLRRADDEWAVT